LEQLDSIIPKYKKIVDLSHSKIVNNLDLLKGFHVILERNQGKRVVAQCSLSSFLDNSGKKAQFVMAKYVFKMKSVKSDRNYLFGKHIVSTIEL